MHSGIVNGYQLLCDAHTVLEPHRGTAAFFSILFTFIVTVECRADPPENCHLTVKKLPET